MTEVAEINTDAMVLGDMLGRESVPLLDGNEEAFVEKIAGRVTLKNYEVVLELNRSGELTEGDLAELGAGANRCVAG